MGLVVVFVWLVLLLVFRNNYKHSVNPKQMMSTGSTKGLALKTPSAVSAPLSAAAVVLKSSVQVKSHCYGFLWAPVDEESGSPVCLLLSPVVLFLKDSCGQNVCTI